MNCCVVVFRCTMRGHPVECDKYWGKKGTGGYDVCRWYNKKLNTCKNYDLQVKEVNKKANEFGLVF
jgi:hypothetical protein